MSADPVTLGVLATVAGLGTAAEARANHVQATQRRDLINNALMRTSKAQDTTDNDVLGEAAKLSPIARAAAFASQADANNTQAKADLSAGGATDDKGNAIIDTSGDNGAVSKEFLTAKADRALSEGNRLSTIAQQLAQTRAPGQVQETEGQRRADLTSNLSNLWSSTNNLNTADQNQAQGIQEPWYGKVGKLAKMAAMIYATGGSAGAGAEGGATAAGLGAYV